MRISTPKSINHSSIFGYGENGNFFSNDNVELPVADNDDPTYYFFDNFTLNEGHTLTTTRPCRGLYIYVANKAIVNGTISMTNRGIYSPPEGIYENGYIPHNMEYVVTTEGPKYMGLPGLGKLAGSDISGQINGGCGGGGVTYLHSDGSIKNTKGNGKGGIAGVFSGGAGAGGSATTHDGSTPVTSHTGVARKITTGVGSTTVIGTTHSSINGGDYGGAGGMGAQIGRGVTTYWWYAFGGNGAGNPSYDHSYWSYPYSGTRLVYVYKKYTTATPAPLYFIANYLEVGSNNLFTCAGTRGSNAFYGSQGGRTVISLYGGGSGGGSLTILYNRLSGIINSNTRGGLLKSNTYSPSGASRIYCLI